MATAAFSRRLTIASAFIRWPGDVFLRRRFPRSNSAGVRGRPRREKRREEWISRASSSPVQRSSRTPARARPRRPWCCPGSWRLSGGWWYVSTQVVPRSDSAGVRGRPRRAGQPGIEVQASPSNPGRGLRINGRASAPAAQQPPAFIQDPYVRLHHATVFRRHAGLWRAACGRS